MNTHPNFPEEDRAALFRKHFSGTPTSQQTMFHILFGIIAPILCLVFDPFIFRTYPNSCFGGAYTYHFAGTFVYAMATLGTLAQIVWLLFGPINRHAASFFAGIFFAGAISSAMIGIWILPMSILFIFFGFIPFLTAYVYGRNALRALAQSLPASITQLLVFMLTGALFVFGVAAIIAPAFEPFAQLDLYNITCAGE